MKIRDLWKIHLNQAVGTHKEFGPQKHAAKYPTGAHISTSIVFGAEAHEQGVEVTGKECIFLNSI